eukprot:768723-Hanusia_phi.AAC.5
MVLRTRPSPSLWCLVLVDLLITQSRSVTEGSDDPVRLQQGIKVQGPYLLSKEHLVEAEQGRLRVLVGEGFSDVEVKVVLTSKHALREMTGESGMEGDGAFVEIRRGERRIALLKVVEDQEVQESFVLEHKSSIPTGGNGMEERREERFAVQLVQRSQVLELAGALLVFEHREQLVCSRDQEAEEVQEVELHTQGGETGRDRTPAACCAACGDFSSLIREQEARSLAAGGG